MIFFSLTKENNLRVNSVGKKGHMWIIPLPYKNELDKIAYQEELVAYCIRIADYYKHTTVIIEDKLMENVSRSFIDSISTNVVQVVKTFTEQKND